MLQPPLPVEYMRLNGDEISQRTGAARAQLADDLLILGHHYQRDEIIRWADHRGDSFKLSRIAAESPDRRFIVFCGVHFMAESADILTSDEQIVILPNLSAGCSMADMANIHQVRAAWRDIREVTGDEAVMPITYVNSAADLKAFVGARGGACCTSSNAHKVLAWALGQRARVFFFPDQHLGRNTACDLGLDADRDMVLWDPDVRFGGLQPSEVVAARIILWKGHCSVHQRFTVEQISQARVSHPAVRVIVHPECARDVVQAADLNGSTERIVAEIRGSAPGTQWAVGTEINLVRRLQSQHPDKIVFCLDPIVCPCSTMYRIHPRYLLWVLENLTNGRAVNQIRVAEPERSEARIALQRMLDIA